MINSHICKILCLASWAITAAAAINVGLTPLGYDVMSLGIVKMSSGLVPVLHYLVGIAGVVSAVKLVLMLTGDCSHCNCKGN